MEERGRVRLQHNPISSFDISELILYETRKNVKLEVTIPFKSEFLYRFSYKYLILIDLCQLYAIVMRYESFFQILYHFLEQ